MCTKTIQNETAKRRDIQDAVRPLAAEVIQALNDHTIVKGDPVDDAAVALVARLGVRTCCITFPGEQHGAYGRECNR